MRLDRGSVNVRPAHLPAHPTPSRMSWGLPRASRRARTDVPSVPDYSCHSESAVGCHAQRMKKYRAPRFRSQCDGEIRRILGRTVERRNRGLGDEGLNEVALVHDCQVDVCGHDRAVLSLSLSRPRRVDPVEQHRAHPRSALHHQGSVRNRAEMFFRDQRFRLLGNDGGDGESTVDRPQESEPDAASTNWKFPAAPIRSGMSHVSFRASMPRRTSLCATRHAGSFPQRPRLTPWLSACRQFLVGSISTLARVAEDGTTPAAALRP